MSMSPEQNSQPESTSVPTEDLRVFMQEWAQVNDKDIDELRGVLERNPDLKNDSRITSVLGRIGARKDLLRDLQGLVASREEGGSPDDLSGLDELMRNEDTEK